MAGSLSFPGHWIDIYILYSKFTAKYGLTGLFLMNLNSLLQPYSLRGFLMSERSTGAIMIFIMTGHLMYW